ncbi:aldo/keto reductase [Colletotrichum phormii]|uniref:Aldo/keto reductase n=1 Tax=Colletotrichum phormii TaxID=359342 RepID=A0AAJ0ECM6_9PEZI|nr:aldo/keto reductase [Colletotrichum phormii]KAK1634942.1 aldo/keto reductase [Colletotrichum phormii]
MASFGTRFPKSRLQVLSASSSGFFNSSHLQKPKLNHPITFSAHIFRTMASALTLQSKQKLNNGLEIPVLGYGLWKTAPEEAEEVTTEALKVGYRHVDSAASYRNEAGAGAAIRGAKDIPRSELFFTSKVRYINYDDAKDQVEETLEKTGLAYINLMLLHCPYGGSEGRKGAWKALVEAQEAGLVKSIGVSNYGVHHLDELETHIKELEEERGGKGKGGAINVAQYEIHPWCARNDIVQWLQKRNVAIEAYSPLVRGERWGDKTLKALADKHGKSEAQILLRWSLQKGYIPLPKSVTPTRILDNTKIYDFQLSDEDVKNLETDEYSPVCWDPTVSPLDGPKSG